MITREEAAALAGDYQWTYNGDTVTNQHGDVVAQRVRIDEEGALIAAAPDLARTVVALYDELEGLRAVSEGRRKLLEEQDERARYASEGLATLRKEIDAKDNLLRTDLKLAQNSEAVCMEELAEKDHLLRLAEASVSLLRGDVDHARLEIRRLRAAEAPGTDDEAFEGTGWTRFRGYYATDGYWMCGGWKCGTARIYDDLDGLKLDAMRAAVPGSV